MKYESLVCLATEIKIRYPQIIFSKSTNFELKCIVWAIRCSLLIFIRSPYNMIQMTLVYDEDKGIWKEKKTTIMNKFSVIMHENKPAL